MDIDDKIDECLKKLYANEDYTMFADELFGDSFMYGAPHIVERAMLEAGLISVEKDARMMTTLGIKISHLGGWIKYQNARSENVNAERKTQEEIQALTKRQLELSIREMQVNFTQIKHWFWIWLISIVASAVLGAWLQSVFK